MPDLIAQGSAIVKAAEAAGRDPVRARNDWRICREVYVADSKNAAMAEIRESLKQSYDYLFKIGLAPLMKRDASMTDAEVTFDWMVENVPWIIGSPEDVITQVRELDDAVGGFGSLLFNSREWVTIDRWNRSLELFARYVSPHFRARDDQRFRAELAADAAGRLSCSAIPASKWRDYPPTLTPVRKGGQSSRRRWRPRSARRMTALPSRRRCRPAPATSARHPSSSRLGRP